MSDNNTSGHYLVMLDERVHETQGRFQGRETIGGLFRDIEQYFQAIRDHLPFCWESSNSQMADPTGSIEHLHRPGSGLLSGVPKSAGRRFRNIGLFQGVNVEGRWLSFVGVNTDSHEARKGDGYVTGAANHSF